jgi:hypothetical protein
LTLVRVNNRPCNSNNSSQRGDKDIIMESK